MAVHWWQFWDLGHGHNNIQPPTTMHLSSFWKDIENFGNLQWEMETPTNKTLKSTSLILDLTTKIQHGQIITCTFQNPMDLGYLYIPPKSAHPPGMMKGITYGVPQKHQQHNSEWADYLVIAVKLYWYLITKGWGSAFLCNVFIGADRKITAKKPSNASSTASEHCTNGELIVLCWTYHPYDLPRNELRNFFYQDMWQLHTPTQSCDAKTKNICDAITGTTLYQAPER